LAVADASSTVKVWTGGLVPKSAEIPAIKGAEFHVIK
jgi:hypothetical protein